MRPAIGEEGEPALDEVELARAFRRSTLTAYGQARGRDTARGRCPIPPNRGCAGDKRTLRVTGLDRSICDVVARPLVHPETAGLPSYSPLECLPRF